MKEDRVSKKEIKVKGDQILIKINENINNDNIKERGKVNKSIFFFFFNFITSIRHNAFGFLHNRFYIRFVLLIVKEIVFFKAHNKINKVKMACLMRTCVLQDTV